MPLQDYRYYRLEAAGHLYMAEWLQAENDDEALAQVGAEHPDAMCEVWEGRRLVGKLMPRGFSPDDASVQDAIAKRLSALALKLQASRTGDRSSPIY